MLSVLQAQTLSDSTKSYLKAKNNHIIEIMSHCISDIHRWNTNNKSTNGIIQVHYSKESDGYTLSLKDYFPKDTIIKIFPDFYFYIDGQIVLWYTEKLRFTKMVDNDFKLFLSGIYSKCIQEAANFKEEDVSKKMNTPIKKRSIEEAIANVSQEDLEKAKPVKILSPLSNIILTSYTYTIKVPNNGNITVFKTQQIY